MANEELITQMVATFADQFEEVETVEESENITSNDIFNMFQDFYPSEYEIENVVEQLQPLFKFKFNKNNDQFVWLIKKK